ncbi:hypothetical protein QN277_015972 [Acacia crassicarpa]|uniref:Uncharacterized protein n=1 Tax=Acacia crassicarpa TaxID=499986 RepID=A0AAE1MVN7_9FABA|nr:hypothetical protein QN277_015972 [Acacia crassicarpa]
MASAGFGLAEIYVQRKFYKEKMKLEEVNAQARLHGSQPRTSGGCFFWPSKNRRTKVARVTDCDDDELGTLAPTT